MISFDQLGLQVGHNNKKNEKGLNNTIEELNFE